MLSKKSQRNGAHYIKDLRTTGPWGVNGVVICRKKKANKANDSDPINDSARAKSHSITGLPPWELTLFMQTLQQKFVIFCFVPKHVHLITWLQTKDSYAIAVFE